MGAGVVILSLVACWVPYSHLQKDQQQLATLRPKVKSLSTVQAELTASQNQLTADQDSLAHLEQSVSSASFVPTMLLDLDKFGKQCGIEVTGVHPQITPPPPVDPNKKQAKPKPYDELTINISGVGTYRSVMDFLKGLATFPKIVAARTVTIVPLTPDPKDPAASKGKVTMTVEIKAYVFKPDDAAGKSSAAAGSQAAVNAANATVPNGAAPNAAAPTTAAPNAAAPRGATPPAAGTARPPQGNTSVKSALAPPSAFQPEKS